MRTSRLSISLRWKIILLVSATAFLSALLVGALNFQSTRDLANSNAVEKLAGQTLLAAANVRRAYDEMKNDAFVLSRTPPVQGIRRSSQHGGVDPRDGSSVGLWRGRLNQIFMSLMEARPHYTQIRYIGLQNNGREIVRVNRLAGDKIEPVAPADMQEKWKEPYFVAGLKTMPGGAYFSEITLNREWGKVDPSKTPTIRIVVPVFDDRQLRFGMIVINADFKKFLIFASRGSSPNEKIYIASDNGGYIYREPASGQFHFANIAAANTPDFLKTIFNNKGPSGHFDTKDEIGYFRRTVFSTGRQSEYFTTIVLMPKSELLASTAGLINQSLISALGLVFIASLAAGLLGNHVTKPITQMTAEVKAFREGRSRMLELPVDLRDEVGEMAKAFQTLISQLVLSNQQRSNLSVQLEAFIANSVDSVIVINERGTIEEVSRSCVELFGFSREELIGNNVCMLMPKAIGRKHDEYLRAYRQTGEKTYIGSLRDEQARAKDGTIFPIELSISEIMLADRRMFTGIIRDVTASREARRKIAQYTKELERSNHELDQFAYVASHDLKAPLRVIDNASKWLEEDLDDKLTEEDRENMTLLRNRVRRMEKLLDDLLEYSRVGRAVSRQANEKVDGLRLIDDVLLLLGPPDAMKVEVSETFGTIYVDRMPLQQVLYNLIGNAIKHHDRDEGHIAIGVAETADSYRFTIRDDGPGIPAAFHGKIFEMFHTLKPRDQVEGSGMGLALVKKIVEHFGGGISVTSGDGRGTEFVVTWPKQHRDDPITSEAA